MFQHRPHKTSNDPFTFMVNPKYCFLETKWQLMLTSQEPHFPWLLVNHDERVVPIFPASNVPTCPPSVLMSGSSSMPACGPAPTPTGLTVDTIFSDELVGDTIFSNTTYWKRTHGTCTKYRKTIKNEKNNTFNFKILNFDIIWFLNNLQKSNKIILPSNT